MQVQGKIQKWGNGLGLRISGLLRDMPKFKEGDGVEIELNNAGFTVKKVKLTKAFESRYTEAELLEGMTAYTAHADLVPDLLTSESID